MFGLSRKAVFARGFALPLLVTRANRPWVAAGMFILSAALYLSTNHFHWSAPRLLPMLWVDSRVPFLPNTVWLYNSDYVYFFIVFFLIRDLRVMNKFIYAFLAILIVSCAIFWFWPTVYPREVFPLPADLNAPTFHVFRLLREADSPANCCPSLHVSLAYLSAFAFFAERSWNRFAFFLTWGTLIAISTLTTKQHYMLDVVAGLFMAVVFHWVFYSWVPYRAGGANV